MKTHSAVRSVCGTVALIVGSTWLAPAINVTYQVDMSVQTTIGNFNPGTDTVFISGNFSNPDWQSGAGTVATNYVLAASGGNPNIYEGTFSIDVATGGAENHKFVINPNGGFAGLRWEDSIPNRTFQVPATDTNLPVVFFDNVNTVPGSRNVTFQVDMSVQLALGNFDPLNDFVQVAGAFNAWSPTASTLTQGLTDTNVWEGTFTVTGPTASTSPYKFLMATFASGEVWEGNVGPGGAQNRVMTLAATDQTEPLVCFNNLCSVPPPAPVTFQVNMAAQMALGNYVDGVNTVTAAGEFNNWSPIAFVLTNNSTEPTIYRGTANVVGAEGAPVAFQYVIDGVSWETAVGNRIFNLTTNGQTLATAFWNNVDDLGNLTVTPAGGGQLDASWTPAPLVRLQVSTGGLPDGWADVPGTTGQSNATVNITTDETYLRLIGP